MAFAHRGIFPSPTTHTPTAHTPTVETDAGTGTTSTEPGGPTLVRIAGVPARQHDGVTCAATAVLLLNAAVDPGLSGWLEQGRRPHRLPPEIAALGQAELAEPDAARRLALAQSATHRLLTRRALGPLAWPRSLGTPPWTMARGLRVPAVRYAHRAVDDHDQRLMDTTLHMLRAATAAGAPVPLYTGGDTRRRWDGDTRRRWDTAVPRHTVVALPGAGEHLRIFDPATGHIHPVAPEELRARRRPHPALGHWTHLAWILIPLVRPWD